MKFLKTILLVLAVTFSMTAQATEPTTTKTEKPACNCEEDVDIYVEKKADGSLVIHVREINSQCQVEEYTVTLPALSTINK